MTVEDVWRASDEFAARFRASDLQPGQLILLATGNRAASVGLFLAARSLGLAVASVDTGTTVAEIGDLSERFGAAAIVAASTTGIGTCANKTRFSDGLDLILLDGSTSVDYRDTALLKLTSGSTGLPKAARATEAQLIADSRQIVAGHGNRTGRHADRRDPALARVRVQRDTGSDCFCKGRRWCCENRSCRTSCRPTPAPSTPRRSRACPSCSSISSRTHRRTDGPAGSDGSSPQGRACQWRRSEASSIDSASRSTRSMARASREASPTTTATRSIDDTVGRPLPGVTITIRPDSDTPPGTGRVHVRSAGVASGYVGETAEEFCGGGFLTGDYGALRPDGSIGSHRAGVVVHQRGGEEGPA